jgi:hypothetical protein
MSKSAGLNIGQTLAELKSKDLVPLFPENWNSLFANTAHINDNFSEMRCCQG